MLLLITFLFLYLRVNLLRETDQEKGRIDNYFSEEEFLRRNLWILSTIFGPS